MPIAIEDFSQSPAVAINGFGRIGKPSLVYSCQPAHDLGRALFRLSLIRTDINLVAVNHTALSHEHLLNAIKHDSTHGPCPQAWEISVAPVDHPGLLPPTLDNPSPSGLLFRGRLIHLFSQRDATKLDWASAGVHTVLESTGKMTTRETAGAHIKFGGAKRVIISAPSKDAPNIVYGVNHHTIDVDERIISNASCTVGSQLSPFERGLIDRQTASHRSRSCCSAPLASTPVCSPPCTPARHLSTCLTVSRRRTSAKAGPLRSTSSPPQRALLQRLSRSCPSWRASFTARHASSSLT